MGSAVARGWKVAAALILAVATRAVPILAESPTFDLGLDLRLRAELTDTPSPDATRDSSYDLEHGRFRLAADLGWEHVKLHAVAQAAGSWNVPSNAAFGSGPSYFGANGESEPSSVDLAELTVSFSGEAGQLVVGRQGCQEGNEVPTGVAYLDTVKRRRIGERLVGNFEWANVGRRFDGASFGVGSESLYLAGFALRPLGAGVSYDHAYESLDELEVYGLSLTGKYDAWLPKSDVRLFAIQYEDGRPGAVSAAGGDLSITTLGASLLAGGERGDLVLWGAAQSGDYGAAEHEAWAAFIEGGAKVATGATLRGGFAVASGDGEAGGDHGTFANLLPTNHKTYGSMDYQAFQNVQELFVELLLEPTPRTSARIAVHHFDLNQEGDAWYSGSGPTDETSLGFVARRPAGGFSRPDLGWEYDFEGKLALARGFALEGGISYFDAGGGGREVLTADGSGWWGFLQLAWKKSFAPTS